jgi:hypothetical protein
MSSVVNLRALDGSNPLAFLAALGAFRLLQLRQREGVLRMRWSLEGTWHPEIKGIKGSEGDICQQLVEAPRVPVGAFSILGKDITVNAKKFAEFVNAAAETCSSRSDRRAVDFAASFGSEVCEDKEKGRIEYTEFSFITGSGHQHFLGTMEGLVANATPEHIRDALFSGWRRQKGYSMRWDPRDAAEYALRWGDPSQDGASAVWGANALAVEALPLFPVQPTDRGLRTTGFQPRRRGARPQFTWPIWTEWASLDTTRSLLCLKELQCPDNEFTRDGLRERGISEVYRSQRVRIGQGANFKVSFRPARAL